MKIPKMYVKKAMETLKNKKKVEPLPFMPDLFGGCKYSSYFVEADLKGIGMEPELKAHFYICKHCQKYFSEYQEDQQAYDKD